MAREIHFVYNRCSGNYIIANSNDLNKKREEIGELEKAISRLKVLCGRERKTDIVIHEGFAGEALGQTLKNMEGYGKVRCVDEEGNSISSE